MLNLVTIFRAALHRLTRVELKVVNRKLLMSCFACRAKREQSETNCCSAFQRRSQLVGVCTETLRAHTRSFSLRVGRQSLRMKKTLRKGAKRTNWTAVRSLPCYSRNLLELSPASCIIAPVRDPGRDAVLPFLQG
jgi:hypothetical protein